MKRLKFNILRPNFEFREIEILSILIFTIVEYLRVIFLIQISLSLFLLSPSLFAISSLIHLIESLSFSAT